MPLVLRSASLAYLMVTCLAFSASLAQSEVSRTPDGSGAVVSVPVFVYVSNGLGQCQFLKDPSGEAVPADSWVFPRIDCENIEINDLKLSDFSLFEDGRKQNLRSAVWETWQTTARDGPTSVPTWGHVMDSVTPGGLWTSPEFDDRFPDNSQHLYLLSYLPDPDFQTRGCHRINVKVQRAHVDVYAQDEYCAGQSPSDPLNGTKEGSELEKELHQPGSGKVPLLMQLTTLRNEPGEESREELVLKFPSTDLQRSWDLNYKFHARIAVLGEVFSKDAKLITRFSDQLWPSWWPTYLRGWQEYADGYYLEETEGDNSFLMRDLHNQDRAWLPTRYETQFDLSPGEYNLRVIISDGSKFGRAEASLTIKPHDGKSLTIGSIVLCKRFRAVHVAAVEAAAANFAPQYVPLVSKGVRFIPAGDTSFASNEKLFAYFQIIDPRIATGPAQQIEARLRIVDTRSAAVVKDFPSVDVSTYEQPGSIIIPIAREIPIDNLRKGQYRLEVQASDASGQKSPWQASAFSIH